MNELAATGELSDQEEYLREEIEEDVQHFMVHVENEAR